MFWLCLACGYVKILQPVAICSYFRNTAKLTQVLVYSANDRLTRPRLNDSQLMGRTSQAHMSLQSWMIWWITS